MKKSIRTLLLCLAAIPLLAGCAAQKNAQAQQQDPALHRAALEALEAGCYVIDIDEIHGPKGQYINVSHSRICKNGEGVLIDLSPKIYQESPYRQLSSLRTDYEDVRTVRSEVKKNGDTELFMQITNRSDWKRSYDLIVTVYADSDKCSVRMGHTEWQTKLCTFRGRIRPL